MDGAATDDPDDLDGGSIEELAGQIGRDPEECWRAFLGLGTLDPETRASLVGALGRLREAPGVGRLLRLMTTLPDVPTREAADRALGLGLPALGPPPPPRPPALAARRVLRGFVSALDGEGRGMIAVSVAVPAGPGGAVERRTAAFRCEVDRGVVDFLDSAGAGAGADDGADDSDFDRLIDELLHGFPVGPGVESPALALGMLAGCLLISGPSPAPAVAAWVRETLGEDFRPRPMVMEGPPAETAPAPPPEAEAMLDACPDWVDRSPLTFELAEEIWLSEGRARTDPVRDAGAYRFLFEHRLIGRLETYRRMLLWMAGVWRASGEHRLADSAGRLAWQLSDDQSPVPSHPFLVALTARSLESAQKQLGTSADPRGIGRGAGLR